MMKGQYFSFDAIIGASIFILTLVAIMSYWYGISSSIEQQQSTLSKESIRIADMLYSPTTVPYGLTVGWQDRHLNWTHIEDEFCGEEDASVKLGSSYAVAIHFSTRTGEDECWWYSTTDTDATGSDYFLANEVYRIRRVASYLLDEDEGATEPGYIDIYVYNPYIPE